MSNTTWQRKAPVLALLLAAGAAGVVAWMQPEDSSPVVAASSAGSLSDASPSTTAPDAAANAVAAVKPPRAEHDPAAHDHDSGPVSDQDIQAQLLADLGELEREFLSEPISPTWSGSTETMIAESLSETRLAPNQAPIPMSHESECRSSSCRIRVTYRNEMEAQMGEIFLLGGIANQLPSANFGRIVAADGTVQIVMYANTGPARKSR